MLLAKLLAILAVQAAPAPPGTAPGAPPTPAPEVPPATAPEAPPAAEPEPEPEPPPADPAALLEASVEAVPEPRKRAYLVVDRVTTAAGMIESEDDEVIVLRDERGRLRSFTKNRLLSITYLLEGPAGRRVRLVFNDGHALVATLVEDGYADVSIEIEGITTRYPRSAVASVTPYPTDRELYERFRTNIEPDQYQSRYTLALWLYGKKMYAESKVELESLLEATNHYEARRLLVEVDAQLALMSGPARERAPRDPRATKPEEETGALLSSADVNLIRVYELDVNDPPRLQVSDELIRTMLEKYAGDARIPARAAEKAAYLTKDPVEIVRTLFALKARELYPQIEVLGEPDSLNLFRQRVHNAWLINNCATSRCHGGPDGGRFYLFNRNHKEDRVRATNLMILARTRIDGLPLVDFEKPTDSLIYQYALPTSEARRPHPDVRGWSPVLNPSRRSLKDDFVRWVRSMRVKDGGYPIEYEPPAMRRSDPVTPAGPDR